MKVGINFSRENNHHADRASSLFTCC